VTDDAATGLHERCGATDLLALDRVHRYFPRRRWCDLSRDQHLALDQLAHDRRARAQLLRRLIESQRGCALGIGFVCR
jgi:hypothetical protein